MIERYGTCLKLYTNDMTGERGRRWLRSIVANLNEIRASHTGRCVLQQLHRTGKHIVIIPWTKPEDSGGAGPQSWRGATYPFRPIRDGFGNYIPGHGTGKGSDVAISLTPSRRDPHDQASNLLHEITHAAEENAGRLYCNKLGWQYLTTAEFDAILVQNMFLSERGRDNRMLQDHGGHLLAGKMIPQPDAYKRLLLSFKARMPALVSDLSHVRAAFNPYRKGAKGWIEL